MTIYKRQILYIYKRQILYIIFFPIHFKVHTFWNWNYTG